MFRTPKKDETVYYCFGINNIAVPAIVTFLGIQELRDKYQHGFISFGLGFSCGLVISIIGCTFFIYSFLYFKVINPGMLAYIRLKQEREMLNRGMSDSDIEKCRAPWISGQIRDDVGIRFFRNGNLRTGNFTNQRCLFSKRILGNDFPDYVVNDKSFCV
ncbi:MAG: DUF4199 domain-containing protein [Bacteroidetes bacterium]|nr:DUF4199 domain-containing protein [Bacteroidota bacterium]